MTQAHHAPHPPVTAGKPVKGAKQPCPLEAKKRCELTQLEVKTKYVSTGDATATPIITKLKTRKRRRGEHIPPQIEKKVGARVVELLSQYDLVIEALAGFPSKGNEEFAEKPEHGMRSPGGVARETKSPANVAEVEVEVELEGECGYARHAVLEMKPAHAPTNKVEIEPEPVHGEKHMRLEDCAWKPGVTRVEIKEILAPSFKADIAGGDNPFTALFRLIMWVWNANKSLDLELRAESCGVHSPTQMGIHDLNALVRVYRDITVAIGIKVPPVRKITESTEHTRGIGTHSVATRTTDVNHSANYQRTVTTEHTQSGFKGLGVFKDAPDEQFALYFKFNELEFLLKETRDKTKEQAEGLKKATENAHDKFKHWHDEHARKAAIEKAIKAAFADFLTFRDKLELFFEGFVSKVRTVIHALRSALDLMKKFPQMGFKITFEVGFLSGDLFFGWAHAPLDSAQPYHGPLADRYAPLLHKIHVESKISLVTFKVEASFGLMIDAGVGSVQARVAGSLGLEVTWQTMLDVVVGAGASNGRGADLLTQQLTGTSTGNLRATFEVKIAWFSYKKEVGVETGIAVDGRIEWKLMKGEIKYSLNVRSLETGWYIYSTNLKTGQANVSLHKIFEARQLMAPLEHTERL